MNLELLTRVRNHIATTQQLNMHVWVSVGIDDHGYPEEEIATLSTLAVRQAEATVDDDVVPVGSCGTSACLAGWTATILINDIMDSLPDYGAMMHWIATEMPLQFPHGTIERNAREALDLDLDQARRLFYTNGASIWAELIPESNTVYHDNPNSYDPTIEEALMVLDAIIANPTIL